MTELLNHDTKQLIKDQYASHPLYKLLKPCKQFEVKMPHLKFSPEEVFLATILRLEELRDAPDDALSAIRYMWDDMVCKYRERQGTTDEETSLAVCEVMCALLLCLNTQDDADSIEWQGCLSSVIADKSAVAQQVMGAMTIEGWLTGDSEQNLAKWVADFMDSDDHLSVSIDRLISGAEVPSDNDIFPLDTMQCIILYSHLLGQDITAPDTSASVLAEFISNITPFAKKSIETTIGRIRRKKGEYVGKIVLNAQKNGQNHKAAKTSCSPGHLRHLCTIVSIPAPQKCP